jgi:adenylate cyclase
MMTLMTVLRPAPAPREAARDIVEFLAGDDCHDLDDAGLIAALGSRLRVAGMPLDRLALHLRTLHPELLGRTIAWAPGEAVETLDRRHGIEDSAAFIDSPIRHVMEMREPLTVRLDDPHGPPWMHIDVYRDRSLAELVILPLRNRDGPASVVVFGTARRQGFAPAERYLLDRIAPALRNVCELRTLRQAELTLLDTYIGSATAQRILGGRIRRGETESLDAALMLCDLRGFTELSNRLPADRVLTILDGYFDRVVPAIADAGGEVLKFMGDAVLAFFHGDDAATACNAALEGAHRVLRNLALPVDPDIELTVGIALHYGTVSYGNIGSGRRLDFTVIGPDVNLVSRIQSVCSATGEHLVMSERFAQLVGSPGAVSIGRHSLKGFAEPQPLLALRGL